LKEGINHLAVQASTHREISSATPPHDHGGFTGSNDFPAGHL